MGLHLQVVRGLRRAAPLALVAFLALPSGVGRAAAAASGPAGPAIEAVDVLPGGVARWDAKPGDRCANGAESWEPIGTACYFPVDLNREPGPLELFLVRGAVRVRAVLDVLPSPYPEERLTLDPRLVTLSRRDRKRVERERKQVVPLFSLRGPARFTLPLSSPLRDAPPPRNFGTRRILNGEPRSPHGGVDFPVPTGTPVLAVAPGRVVLVANHFFSGRSVYVDHGDGLLSMSMHLSRVRVRKGQRVKAGDRLGLSGATGRVSGPHLHFGLRWRGARIDPALLLGDPEMLPRVREATSP